VQGFISSAEDIDAYVIQVSVPALLKARLSNLASDYDLHVVDVTSEIIRESIAEGTESEAIELQVDSAGTYFVYVNSGRGGYSENQPYDLYLELIGPSGALTSEPPDVAAPIGTPADPGHEPQPAVAAPTFPKKPIPPCVLTMAFPSDLFLQGPSSSLQPELAAYSGVWEGKWGNVVNSRLAVEWIDASSAMVVYAWGDNEPRMRQTGWIRQRANVLADWTIAWGKRPEPEFSFKIGRDLQSVDGVRVTPSNVTSVMMFRCALS
jgi:hypothetical protein